MISMSNVMDYLYDNRAPNLPAAYLAEIFDSLIWCLHDQGQSLLEVRKQWIDGNDRGKLEVALYMSEVFPAKTRSELVTRLTRVAEQWPDLKERCDQLVADWDNVVR